MRRNLSASAISTALAMVVGAGFATGAIAQESSPREKITFTLGEPHDIDSMSPLISVESGYYIFPMIYDLLLNFAPADLSLQPGLATEVPTTENGGISSDGLTYTFHIREGMRWSDGEPLTANDIAYTFNRAIDEHWGCCFSYLKLADSIEAPDDTTLVIRASQPSPQMLTIYVYTFPEHIWKDVSPDEAKTFENFPTVASGPFVPVEWKKGQFMRLERNPNYWGPQPHIDEIVYRVFNNLDAAVAGLKSGEVDFIDLLTSNLFNSLKGQQGIGTHAASVVGFEEIGMNTGALQGDGNPALQDETFREALSMAVDKQELVDKVVLGYAEPGSTFVSPTYGQYHLEIPEDQQIPFDIAGANRLLDEAGYADTDGNGVRNAKGGGDDIVLRYFVRSENEDTVNTAPFVKAWFEQIGVDTEVQALSDNKLTDVIIDGKYDIFHWGWSGDPTDPDFIASIFTCEQRPELNADGKNIGGIWSDSYYCNAQFDRQYLEQKTLLDIPQRVDVFHRMQQEVYDAKPYIVLWYNFDLQAYNSAKWTGFRAQPEGNGDLLAQYGPFSYLNIRPKAGEAGGSNGPSSIPVGVWIAIASGLAVIVAAVVLRRRRVGDEDRA